MKIIDCIQNSPEWYAARLGRPTASCFDKIITPGGKASAQADGYANKLIAEMMTGEQEETFTSVHMERGKELEQQAAQFYDLQNDVETVAIGFVTDDSGTVGCSPDRLVGEDGLLEIKIPKASNHVAYLLKANLDKDYYPQAQGQLFITGRLWVDMLSYHPKMPPSIIRVERDEPYLKLMAELLADFTVKLKAKRQVMIDRGYIKREVEPEIAKIHAATAAQLSYLSPTGEMPKFLNLIGEPECQVA